MGQTIQCECGRTHHLPDDAVGDQFCICGEELLETLSLADTTTDTEPSDPAKDTHMDVYFSRIPGGIPAKLKASLPRWVATYHLFFLSHILSILGIWFLTRWLHGYPLLSAFFLVMLYFTNIDMGSWLYRSATLLPGRIVGSSPWRVATLANLSTGEESGNYPTIKITSIPTMTYRGNLEIGTPVAMIACFAKQEKDEMDYSSRFGTFLPEPAACSAASMEDVQKAMSRISREEWKKLDDAISLLPLSMKKGMYSMWDRNAIGAKLKGFDLWFRFNQIMSSHVLFVFCALVDAGIFWLIRKFF